jgi:hypothetical protein
MKVETGSIRCAPTANAQASISPPSSLDSLDEPISRLDYSNINRSRDDRRRYEVVPYRRSCRASCNLQFIHLQDAKDMSLPDTSIIVAAAYRM